MRRWAWATAAYAVLILVVSVIPIAAEGPDVPQLDKLAHLGEYLVFAWMLQRAWHASRGQVWAVSAGYGGLIELLQACLPWRSGSFWDMLANAAGAALGLWAFRRRRRS